MLHGGEPECGVPGLIPCDEFDVDDDTDDGEPTPDLDLNDRVQDGNNDGTGRIDMGVYEHVANLCPWDLNGDCCVNEEDLAILVAAAGPCPPLPAACPADFDCNGVINRFDARELIQHYGPCPNTAFCPAPPPGCGVGSSAAAIGGALAQIGFADVADYAAWVPSATESQAFVCACVLQVLLEAQP